MACVPGTHRRSTYWARSRELGGDDEQAARRLVAQAVVLAQAGDREALAFLYTRYAEDIYGYVHSIVHDHHEAEDITQHVFAKLIGVIGSYREREVPFFAWMLRVARNVAIDHIRKQRLVPVEEVRTVDAPATETVGAGRINDIKEALATLPPAQREVLVLRHFAGLSPREIAARTGRTEGSIHGLHHRGRRALWGELETRDAAPITQAARVPRLANWKRPCDAPTVTGSEVVEQRVACELLH